MSLLLFETNWRDVWEDHTPDQPVGAVFTKPEIIELILDMAGYTPEKNRLADSRLLEPSCGDGAFLAAAVTRLLSSELTHRGHIDWGDESIGQAITACDVNSGFVAEARRHVTDQLIGAGCPTARAEALAERWVEHADFLLTMRSNRFDYVVGNPPYVRIEELPERVLRRYRETFATCADRADLYVAFFEQGLRLLSERGALAFICANRFAKNLYGRGLRELIARQFHVRYYINLEHTQPFVTEVSAYPCITVIDRDRGQPTRAASLDNLEPGTLARIIGDDHFMAAFPSWYQDDAPWVATDQKAYLQHMDLARRHPLLEDSAENTRAGIGVATGIDEVYVLPIRQDAIEAECQLPLLMAKDITPSRLSWSGSYLANPFENNDAGELRDLTSFPGLASYFERHRVSLEKRHTAKKNPQRWYRTIDKVTHSLAARPKLVIPDIQNGGVVGFDVGNYYPHHNVYWITSDGWNLQALQALLRSSLVLEQVRANSVQMRGGAFRYQTQVLRRLRIPAVRSLSPVLIAGLAAISGSADQEQIDRLALLAFAS